MTHRHRNDESRFALRAALSGAAAAFLVVSLFEFGIIYLDLIGLRTLLTASATELSFSTLLWPPLCCAVIGFAIGPSVAGPPTAHRPPRAPRASATATTHVLRAPPRRPVPSSFVITLVVAGLILWMAAGWALGKHHSQRLLSAPATCHQATSPSCGPSRTAPADPGRGQTTPGNSP